MLQIEIPASEWWDESTNSFINVKPVTLTLEHSLVSLSKWESKWCKPFLTKDSKTNEETLDYIRCMTLTQNVDPNVYLGLTSKNIEEIKEYINNPHSATTIHENSNAPRSRETITSELIYYWMIALNIPPEYQKWHLNRLLTLIKVCNVKNSPPKKMSQRELLRQRRAMNESRLKHARHRG